MGGLQGRGIYDFCSPSPRARSSRSRSSCTSSALTPSGSGSRLPSAAWRRANACATSLTAPSASSPTASLRRALSPPGPPCPAVSRGHLRRRCRSHTVYQNHHRRCSRKSSDRHRYRYTHNRYNSSDSSSNRVRRRDHPRSSGESPG